MIAGCPVSEAISLGPRLVVAGTHSGVGKTTIATGLMAALRSTGLHVASAKVGPDFIDPGYHSIATGRPPRNLDAWMCGRDALGPLASRAAVGCDLLVIEGVMGLFDGSVDPMVSGELATASTAQVAAELQAPILLVIDGSSMSTSAAALVNGFAKHHADVRVAGIVLNRVGSDTHEMLLREAVSTTGIPVMGALRRDDRLAWRDRHLGLIPVAEQRATIEKSVAALSAMIAESCDLQEIFDLARRASELRFAPPRLPAHVGSVRIAIASGQAFTFCYPDNLEALASAGAEIIPFDPLIDPTLPENIDALIVGGGFPEEYGAGLADNRPLLSDVLERVGTGLVTWAECGGLLWLGRELTDRGGGRHQLAGVLNVSATMTTRLTLGYRRATLRSACPIGSAGMELRGHEFHYSTTDPKGDALQLQSRFVDRPEGFASSTLLATYLHTHLGAAPTIAEQFIRTALYSRETAR